MAYKFSETHEYVNLSKKKPFICAVCLQDITHPIHQPSIKGLEVARQRAQEHTQGEELQMIAAPSSQISLF